MCRGGVQERLTVDAPIYVGGLLPRSQGTGPCNFNILQFGFAVHFMIFTPTCQQFLFRSLTQYLPLQKRF